MVLIMKIQNLQQKKWYIIDNEKVIIQTKVQ